MEVKNNSIASRYELEIDGQIVFAEYSRQNGAVRILHVEAPQALRGKGAAGKLMQGMMELMRAEDLKAIPVCSYAVSWLARHTQYDDIVVT